MSHGGGCCNVYVAQPRMNYNRLEQIASSQVSHVPETRYSISNSMPESFTQPSYMANLATFIAKQTPYISAFEVSRPYQTDNSVYDLFKTHQEYNFVPDNFLVPGKGGKFVGKAEDIQDFVEEAFMRIFNETFPQDIKISVLDKKEFSQIAPNSSTVGLSINRRKHGLISEIFVLNDTLGRVLLTFGHELGHVLTETLGNSHDEEAKAYAFSLAWMDVIKEHNIAGLGDAIVTESPAQNGLHDVSFSFVAKMMRQGKKAWEVYREVVSGSLAVAG